MAYKGVVVGVRVAPLLVAYWPLGTRLWVTRILSDEQVAGRAGPFTDPIN